MSLTQAWESLEEAEYRRELALREELIRQEKLEQLARRFDRKAAMRETWLNENQRLVAQVVGGTLGMAGGRSFPEPQLASQWQWDKPLHRPCGPAPHDWVNQHSRLRKNSPWTLTSRITSYFTSQKLTPGLILHKSIYLFLSI